MITDQLFKSFIQNNIKYAQIWGGANTDHNINLFPDSAFILWYLHISGVCDCLWREAVGHAHDECSEDTPSSRRPPSYILGVFWVKDHFLPPEMKQAEKLTVLVCGALCRPAWEPAASQSPLRRSSVFWFQTWNKTATLIFNFLNNWQLFVLS